MGLLCWNRALHLEGAVSKTLDSIPTQAQTDLSNVSIRKSKSQKPLNRSWIRLLSSRFSAGLVCCLTARLSARSSRTCLSAASRKGVIRIVQTPRKAVDPQDPLLRPQLSTTKRFYPSKTSTNTARLSRWRSSSVLLVFL